MDPVAGPKTHWTIVKTFLNNKKFLTFLLYFKTANLWQIFKKADLFNCLFTKHCSIIDNSRELPLYCNINKDIKKQ